jgi:hypothetical protein
MSHCPSTGVIEKKKQDLPLEDATGIRRVNFCTVPKMFRFEYTSKNISKPDKFLEV